MNFLLANGLVKRNQNCPRANCRRRMILIRDRSVSDRFHCPKRCSTASICKGSFIEQSRMSIREILYVAFCWAGKMPMKTATFVSGVRETSVLQWYQFLREKCSESLINCPNYVFGGPGVVVQIDESLVAKRKYHVGQQQWVFGLYDTSTKLGHIDLVDDRRAETLIPLIQKYILPGAYLQTVHCLNDYMQIWRSPLAYAC